MIKAVVFDFDGLIIDTETVWYETYLEILQEYGGSIALEDFARFIGTHNPDMYPYICRLANNQITVEELFEKKAVIHAEKMAKINAREGVEEYLRDAKKMGLKIGLASSSSKSWVTSFLKNLNLYDYFEVIKTSDDVDKVKPDPELYLQALQALEVKPQEAIAFEDSGNGLNAAVAAGIKCVIIPNKVTEVLTFKDHSLRLNSMGDMGIEEVIKILDEQK